MKFDAAFLQRQCRRGVAVFVGALFAVLLTACNDSSSSDSPVTLPPIIVNSLLDDASPAQGTVTLRSAVMSAASGQPIQFDPSLDGRTLDLSIVGQEHTVLTGEVMGFDEDNNISFLIGYHNRDHGRSALFAQKDLVLDASALPNGITLRWNGAEDARVMAVDGNLTLTNIAITGGKSTFAEAEDVGQHPDDDQTSTLARGAGVAVWGLATLRNCVIYDNHAQADEQDQSRDGGAYGGGVYADTVDIENCVISGNTVAGGGAAGGGVFSVGGRGTGLTTSRISQSAITENRITGLFAYGGGVYSDGGGIGLSTRIHVINTTIARNVVEPLQLPPFLFSLLDIGYWRGGGLYMSNGYMLVRGTTLVENQVFGKPRTTEIDKPNLAGGIAATIGNAHAVEDMLIGQSILVGNTVHEIDGFGLTGYTIGRVYNHDIFTGSVFEFRSLGYNRIGVMDFSQILVPIGEPGWASLSRKHFPQTNDVDGVAKGDVLGAPVLSSFIPSAGVKNAPNAVLYYEPRGSALAQVPSGDYTLTEILGDLAGPENEGRNPELLPLILDRLEQHYSQAGFAADFRTYFENYLTDIDPDTEGAQQYRNCNNVAVSSLEQAFWCGPSQTWPQEAFNFAYIEFWHHLHRALAGEISTIATDSMTDIGAARINDAVWTELFGLGESNHAGITVRLTEGRVSVRGLSTDQRGMARPDSLADIGAIELE